MSHDKHPLLRFAILTLSSTGLISNGEASPLSQFFCNKDTPREVSLQYLWYISSLQ